MYRCNLRHEYTVPVRYMHKEVTVIGYAKEVNIYHDGELVTTFNRIYGSGKTEWYLDRHVQTVKSLVTYGGFCVKIILLGALGAPTIQGY